MLFYLYLTFIDCECDFLEDLGVLQIETSEKIMTATEKDEFLAAYKDLHEPLMRFCIVKSRGIMDAKDLANDVLLVGLENYSKLDEKKALLSYLFTTATRICLNKVRRQKFKGEFSENTALKLEDSSSDAAEKVDVSFLYEALDQLPALQKEAVILFEISDLPIKEIMTIQNSGESAVKQRIKRGREKLAEILGEKEKRKIALLIPLFVTSQSFAMSHIDLYFQAIKALPLPLSSAEATTTISGFNSIGASPYSGASKFGTGVIKKIGLSVLAAVVGISSIVLLTSPTETSTDNSELSTTIRDENSSILIPRLVSNETSEYVSNSNALNQSLQLQEPNALFGFVSKRGNDSIQLNTPKTDTLKKEVNPTIKQPSIPLTGDIFPLENIATVRFDNLGDHVVLKTWDRNEVKIIANHTVEAKTPEDEALIRANLSFKAEQKGDVLLLKSSFCNAKRSTLGFGKNKLNTIQFDGGEKIKYKSIVTNYTVMLPASANIDLSGHYKTFSVPAMQGDLITDLFETTFICGSIEGKAHIELHHSKATLNDFQQLDLHLFESTVYMNDVEELTLEAKYGTIVAHDVTGSKVALFESKLTLNKYSGPLDLNAKYSTLNFTESKISQANIVAFQSKIVVPTFKNLTIDLRYSTLKSETIANLDIPVSFESKLFLGAVSTINSASSKYSMYTISQLNGKIEMNSFEDKLTIQKTNLAPMTFNGKYTTYIITLAEPSNYQFKLDGNYCQLNYGTHPLKISRSEVLNAHKILEGYFHAADTNSALISFDCFESNITLL